MPPRVFGNRRGRPRKQAQAAPGDENPDLIVEDQPDEAVERMARLADDEDEPVEIDRFIDPDED